MMSLLSNMTQQRQPSIHQPLALCFLAKHDDIVLAEED